MKRIPHFPGLAFLIATFLLLSACSDEIGSQSSVSGVAGKGPLNGSTVCAYAITGGAKGVPIGSCSVTDSVGNYRIDLQGYAGSVLLQASGGTYVDEATGTKVSLSIPLHSMADVTGDSASVAVTALTELAYRNASALAGGLTPANIQTATVNVQNNFGVADIVHVMPVGALSIPAALNVPAALYMPAGTTSAQLTYGFALAAVSQYSHALGISLEASLQTIQACLVSPTTGCATADGMTVGANLYAAMKTYSTHLAIMQMNIPGARAIIEPTIGLGFSRTVGTGPISVATGKLNDTGMTASQCYQAGSDAWVACNSAAALALNNQQDGMTGRDANLVTSGNGDGKLGFSFTALPSGCVQDNNTGLVWEVKTADGGIRDRARTYTYGYDYPTIYGLPRVPLAAAPTTALDYAATVNATNLCGYSDWRLPTIDELHSIVDYSVAAYGMTIDSDWFPNTQADEYWSSSTYSYYWPGSGSGSSGSGSTLCLVTSDCSGGEIGGGSVNAIGLGEFRSRLVNFSIGYDRSGSNLGSHYVRLVRADPPPGIARYAASGDGQEVTDNKTGLVWRRCAEGMVFGGGTCSGTATAYTHEAALQQAANQASSTGVAWRLPDIKELASIADKSLSSGPSIDVTAFPATPVSFFWSASPFVSDSAYAWGVSFGEGFVGAGLRLYPPADPNSSVGDGMLSLIAHFYASATYRGGGQFMAVAYGHSNVRLVRTAQ